jgi:ferrous iron transport protein A
MRSRGWFGGRGWGGRGRRRRRGRGGRDAPLTLADLREGESGVVDSLELPEDVALRLMELGFIPGTTVVAGRAAPGGDPRVYRVDGSEIALRRETTQHLLLRFLE